MRSSRATWSASTRPRTVSPAPRGSACRPAPAASTGCWTSARAHAANAPRYAAAGIRAVDLTPAAIGPYVCPAVNLEFNLDAPNLNMITCGGQATVPIVAAVSRAVEVPYAEIVASTASRSAGPGTRANIDEFTEVTARGLEEVGGARQGKAIIILNPVEPPMIMRNTVFCAIPAEAAEPGPRRDRGQRPRHGRQRPPLRSRLHAARRPPVRPSRRSLAWHGARRCLPRGSRARRLPARLRRQPRHHDRGRRPGRRPPGRAPDRAAGRSHRVTATHVRLTDSTLRDGSHALAHQFTEGQVRAVVHALDRSNVEVIEVSHGDGLGGSSFNYGFSRVSEFDLIAAAVEEADNAKIAVLLLPGLGTVEDLRHARDVGASVARIATHCTEADVSVQHFGGARELGMETVGLDRKS